MVIPKGIVSPLQAVAREMSRNSSMDEDGISLSLQRLLHRSMEEASSAMREDPYSQRCLQLCLDYQALSESILGYGTLLLSHGGYRG